jgi:F-type H+-transporting ATPase subunit alpha
VAILWVVTNGFLDDVPTARVKEFEQQLYRFLEAERPEVLGALAERRELSDEIVAGLRDAATAFKETFSA